MPSYVNKRGKTVQLQVTRHAYHKFAVRYNRAFPHDKVSNADIPKLFDKFFSETKRVEKLGRKGNIRLKRYGNDTMYFRTNFFTFTVQNATIITVELSNKDMRHLN